MESALLKYWLLVTVLLGFKMWANSGVQIWARLKHKTFPNPEDAVSFGSVLKMQLEGGKEPALAVRAAACWRNDLENIPLFIILALAYVLFDGPMTAGLIYFSSYTIVRSFHTFFYIKGLQPWRTLAFETGALITLTMMLHALYLAFMK